MNFDQLPQITAIMLAISGLPGGSTQGSVVVWSRLEEYPLGAGPVSLMPIERCHDPAGIRQIAPQIRLVGILRHQLSQNAQSLLVLRLRLRELAEVTQHISSVIVALVKSNAVLAPSGEVSHE